MKKVIIISVIVIVLFVIAFLLYKKFTKDTEDSSASVTPQKDNTGVVTTFTTPNLEPLITQEDISRAVVESLG